VTSDGVKSDRRGSILSLVIDAVKEELGKAIVTRGTRESKGKVKIRGNKTEEGKGLLPKVKPNVGLLTPSY
jgi:hypothetical protein